MDLKHAKFLLFAAFVLCIVIPVSVYAETVPVSASTETGIISNIINDQVVLMSVGITIVGVGLKAICAVLKHGIRQYDYRMTAVSFILGFLVSLQLVSTSIENLPIAATSSTYLIIIVGEILTVMGVDSGAKAVGQKLGVAKNKEEQTKKESEGGRQGA